MATVSLDSKKPFLQSDSVIQCMDVSFCLGVSFGWFYTQTKSDAVRAAAAGGDLETASAWLTRAAGSSKPIRLSLSVMVTRRSGLAFFLCLDGFRLNINCERGKCPLSLSRSLYVDIYTCVFEASEGLHHVCPCGRQFIATQVSLMDAAAKMGNLTMAEAFFKYGQRMKVQHPMASYNILIKAALRFVQMPSWPFVLVYCLG